MNGRTHIPVMADEVIQALAPVDGGIYIDGTFGAGGYSQALLSNADCRVIGFDCDPDAVAAGAQMEAQHRGRLALIHGHFSGMAELAANAGAARVQGVALDLGVSSMQLDQAERGFSFAVDGPLDMRMSQNGESAADVVNSRTKNQLADIIYQFGEERRSRAVAGAIVREREVAPIVRTAALAKIIAKVVKGSGRIHPATRTFQALRIYVNGEIGELRKGLVAAERLLAPQGRLAVVSFHSLEDREVKNFLIARSGSPPRGSRHRPPDNDEQVATFELSSRSAIKPSEAEITANPRSRSARLRVAQRNGAPV